MCASKLNGKILRLALPVMLCTTVIPFRSLADDKGPGWAGAD
jgi:hypothetical protein